MSRRGSVLGPSGMRHTPPLGCTLHLWDAAAHGMGLVYSAFTYTHVSIHTAASVQACHSSLPCTPVCPPGSLAAGPAAMAGILPRAAPGHSSSRPVSLQAAAPRGCAVPASQCSCAWRASPSSRRSWLTTRRAASSRVSLAGGAHTPEPRGGSLECCSHAALLQTVSAAGPSWKWSPRAERPGPAHHRAALRRRWARGC